MSQVEGGIRIPINEIQRGIGNRPGNRWSGADKEQPIVNFVFITFHHRLGITNGQSETFCQVPLPKVPGGVAGGLQ